ncbi:PREDICTED: uncharacterized protein LOC108371589 [Rhagoletis zephyria]|uniref:uncharacterized protein LOC108371589 n=1 Tax=Rhagoletis zephyria TaxID=28612 RepID=UPI0008115311|nr:PREDICTED: uncharacterized protein LOC108371589 [Rhagoletis zephyria]
MEDAGNMNAPKSKRKRLAWTEHGEVALLDLWEERVVDLRSSRKTGHIYAQIAAELAKLGHKYSARDIQVKLANFTQRYRKEKATMGVSPSSWPFYGRVHQIIGGYKSNLCSELTLETLETCDLEIKQSPPNSLPSPPDPLPSPNYLLPSPNYPPPSPNKPLSPRSSLASPLLTPLPKPSSPLNELPSTSGCEPQTRKRKNRDYFFNKVLENFEEVSREIRQHFKDSKECEKEFVAIEKEKLEALKDISKANMELKDAFISFLNR